ncbi:response regulator transcription factor [Pseudonocardia xinjiangensis]|uniref:response regulator transcription factor n=1 Tax=Pseudonocardia xinjiangensis TaxID=75289 RepID=UPI003D914355
MIRILLADDERLIRDAIAGLLDLDDDFEVVGQAASGDEAIATALRLRPDVALLDLQIPGPDGIEVARRLATELPDCRCVIVTSHGRPGYLKSALAAGVRGFLPKTVSFPTLAHVVRKVAAGGRYVDPELAAEAIGAGDSPLTPRETDVLAFARDGAPVEEIAQRVSLSRGTVRNHLAAAIGKLGAANRHEAARIAAEHGWI